MKKGVFAFIFLGFLLISLMSYVRAQDDNQQSLTTLNVNNAGAQENAPLSDLITAVSDWWNSLSSQVSLSPANGVCAMVGGDVMIRVNNLKTKTITTRDKHSTDFFCSGNNRFQWQCDSSGTKVVRVMTDKCGSGATCDTAVGCKPKPGSCISSNGVVTNYTGGIVIPVQCTDNKLIKSTCSNSRLKTTTQNCGNSKHCDDSGAGSCATNKPVCNGPSDVNDVTHNNTVSVTNSAGRVTSHSDRCDIYYDNFGNLIINDKRVLKWYCNNGNAKSDVVSCLDGTLCVKGACLPPTFSCTDSDGGNNASVRGIVRLLKNGKQVDFAADSCQGKDLIEFYCSPDGTQELNTTYKFNVTLDSSGKVACPNGCDSGACKR